MELLAEDGYYWYKPRKSYTWEMVYIARECCLMADGGDERLVLMMGGRDFMPIGKLDGDWVGPVKPPKGDAI